MFLFYSEKLLVLVRARRFEAFSTLATHGSLFLVGLQTSSKPPVHIHKHLYTSSTSTLERNGLILSVSNL